MSYCLNPSCAHPQNPSHSNFCRNCGGKLRLRDRYLAVEPIGQGGFGRTFKAIDEDKPSKPFCVIKQFFPQVEGTSAAQKAAELFTHEASALERLDFPNIPKLLAYFITQDSQQYLVQEFINGQNLKVELETHGAFNASQINELLTAILPTLDYLHGLNLIHRDIKPDNIIRRADDRRLFLVDFGALKQATPDRSQMQGTTIGTPEFMAPEQGWGRAFPSSDLYSLGVTCLNLLTKVSPFDLYDDDRGQWHWRDRVVSPIDPHLAAILDRLIQPRPIDRYSSASEVLAALEGKHAAPTPAPAPAPTPISASPASAPVPQPAVAAATAPTPTITVEALLATALDPKKSTPTPTRQPTPPSPPTAVGASKNWTCDYIFTWHSKPVNAVAIFPNGQYLVSGDDGGTVAVWNLMMPQQPIATYCTNGAIYSVAGSPDLHKVASGDKNRRIQMRHKDKINFSQDLHCDGSGAVAHHGFVYGVRFSPDGRMLASCGADRRIRLWNADTGKIIYTLDGHVDTVTAIEFMPNGLVLISAGVDRTIRFWDLTHKQLLKTVPAHDREINALAISRDGKLIVSGSSDRTLQLRQLGTSESHTLTGHQSEILAVAIDPEARTIAAGTADGTIYLWDVNSKQLISSFSAHAAAIKSLVFQINGKFLITASADRTIKLWQSI